MRDCAPRFILVLCGLVIWTASNAADQVATAIGNCNVVVNAKEASRVEITNNCSAETAAALEALLQKERAARLALAASVAPRTLSQAQRTHLIAALKTGKGMMVRVIRLGDAEAGSFADELVEALQQAGVEVVVPSIGMMGSSSPMNGLFLSLNRASNKASVLEHAFSRAGVAVVMRDHPINGVDAELLVGYRPLGVIK